MNKKMRWLQAASPERRKRKIRKRKWKIDLICTKSNDGYN